MSDIRAGALIRAARQRRGLRQLDLAEATGVSQQTVSLIERGHLDRLGLATVRAVAAFVEVDLPLAPRYRGAEGDRLLDAGHARIVDALVDLLGRHGWQTIVEYSFSHFGERGSVDVVGWRAAQRALLIVEVKTELVDVQQTLRSMGIKERVVPPLLARDHGWREVERARPGPAR